MNKNSERERAIQQLLREEEIESQLVIVERLKDRFTIDSSQVQVSRDLKKLGVIKQGSHYRLPDENAILSLAVAGVAHNDSMVVVKTTSGLADYVGDWLDGGHLPILGTIAGENVVFVAPKKNVKETYEALIEIFAPYLSNRVR